jgi:hypothetical protein
LKAVVDQYLNKFISRKLIIVGLATTFLYLGAINGDQWVAIALAYVGVQGFTDAAVKWKHGGNP